MRAVHRSNLSSLVELSCGLCFNFCRGNPFQLDLVPHRLQYSLNLSGSCHPSVLDTSFQCERMRITGSGMRAIHRSSFCPLVHVGSASICIGGNPSELDHMSPTLQHSMKLSGHLHPSVLDTSYKCEQMPITGSGMKAIHRSSFCPLVHVGSASICIGGNPSELDHMSHTLQHSMKLSGHLHPSVLDTSYKCEQMRITGSRMKAILRSSFCPLVHVGSASICIGGNLS
jgi:hypothetical protein